MVKNEKLLRWAEVRERTGIGRTTAWELTRKGKFPASLKLSEGRVGWRESDIDAWIASRVPAGAA